MTGLTTEALENAIAALETHRLTLGDDLVNTALGPLRRHLAAVRAAQTLPGEAQRKTITVLFATLADFESYSHRRDAARLAAEMDALWARLDPIVLARGGLVDKHIGGTLMALWGATATGEDDAEQAVKAALAMLDEVNWRTPSYSLQIGLNTGLALLSAVGGRGEFTAMGDTVNVAARLAQAAGADQVFITHETYRQVRGLFDVQALAPLALKGKHQPVPVYDVLRAKPLALQLGARGVEGVETSLVGRTAELTQLQESFQAALRNTETHALTVVGEAGLGKSRLLYEFTIWLDLLPNAVNYLKGRATHHTEFAPYALLRDVFTFRFDIRESDSASVVRKKFEQGLAPFFATPTDPTAHLMRAHFIGQMLGFNFADSPHLAGLHDDTRQIRSRALYYLAQYFRALSADAPTLLYLEDIHWADRPSLEAVRYVLKECPNLRLLVVALARPALFERDLPWVQWANTVPHNLIHLPPLDAAASRTLATNILQRAPNLPPALLELVVARAEGNPFYIEELIKMLMDDGVITRQRKGLAETWEVHAERLAELRVPATLAGLLQARLDRLRAAERAALQRASVMGRVFWDAAVRALEPANALAEDEPWSALVQKELIYHRQQAAFADTREFIFKHTVLRDVTYESVLKRERRIYHHRAANWLVRMCALNPHRAEEYTVLIATHYEHAGENQAAATYFERAALRAMRLSAFAEALRFFQRAAELYPAHDTTLVLHQAEAWAALANFAAARQAAERALHQATTETTRATALALLGDIAATTGDYLQAGEHYTQALMVARTLNAPATLARVLYGLGDVHWRLGNNEVAENFLNESLRLCEQTPDIHRKLYVLNRLGTLQTDLHRAEQLYNEVHTTATAVGNRERAMVALNNLGDIAIETGDFRRALDLYLQALLNALEIGAQASAALYEVNAGYAHMRLHHWEEAVPYVYRGTHRARTVGAWPWAVWGLICFGCLALARGQTDHALRLFGVARVHPAFNVDFVRLIEAALAEWQVDEATARAGMAPGATLNFEEMLSAELAAYAPAIAPAG